MQVKNAASVSEVATNILVLPSIVQGSAIHILKILSHQRLKFLGIMRKLNYSISRNALNQMYMSFILPVVEYASGVWDGCSEQDSHTLQKIQNEAAALLQD